MKNRIFLTLFVLMSFCFVSTSPMSVKNGHMKKKSDCSVECSYCGKILKSEKIKGIERVNRNVNEHLILFHNVDIKENIKDQDSKYLKKCNDACIKKYSFSKKAKQKKYIKNKVYLENGHVKNIDSSVICNYCDKKMKNVFYCSVSKKIKKIGASRRHLVLSHRVNLEKKLSEQDFDKLRKLSKNFKKPEVLKPVGRFGTVNKKKRKRDEDLQEENFEPNKKRRRIEREIRIIKRKGLPDRVIEIEDGAINNIAEEPNRSAQWEESDENGETYFCIGAKEIVKIDPFEDRNWDF